MSNAIVIIPTYKERENIRAIIEAVFSLPKVFHVLIVDDNSPDGTAEIVEELQKKFNVTEQKLRLMKRPGKQGLGTAYIAGLALNTQLLTGMISFWRWMPTSLTIQKILSISMKLVT
jgi:glycosyltransferase involved in cell wall biosynthesis